VGLGDDGTIATLQPTGAGSAAAGEDWGGDWLSPPGVDLQINGGLGLAFPELTASDLPRLEALLEHLWRDGVEAIAPTLVTCGVAELRGALAVLAQARARHGSDIFTDTSNLTLITGPSRTADIEMTLSLGIHGPQEIHVVLVEH